MADAAEIEASADEDSSTEAATAARPPPDESDEAPLRPRRAWRRGPAYASWGVTFVDLLTLLLGFFLAILATSPPGRLPNEAPPLANSPEASGAAGEPKGGTPLANPDDGQGPVIRDTVVISENAFHVEEGVGEAAEREIAELAGKTRASVERITVETCGGGGTAAAGWMEASRRALTVRSLLMGNGIAAERISLRVNGGACGALSGLADGAGGRIRVEQNTGSDGRRE